MQEMKHYITREKKQHKFEDQYNRKVWEMIDPETKTVVAEIYSEDLAKQIESSFAKE